MYLSQVSICVWILCFNFKLTFILKFIDQICHSFSLWFPPLLRLKNAVHEVYIYSPICYHHASIFKCKSLILQSLLVSDRESIFLKWLVALTLLVELYTIFPFNVNSFAYLNLFFDFSLFSPSVFLCLCFKFKVLYLYLSILLAGFVGHFLLPKLLLQKHILFPVNPKTIFEENCYGAWWTLWVDKTELRVQREPRQWEFIGQNTKKKRAALETTLETYRGSPSSTQQSTDVYVG